MSWEELLQFCCADGMKTGGVYVRGDGARSGAGRRKEEEVDVGFGKLESRNNVLQNSPWKNWWWNGQWTSATTSAVKIFKVMVTVLGAILSDSLRKLDCFWSLTAVSKRMWIKSTSMRFLLFSGVFPDFITYKAETVKTDCWRVQGVNLLEQVGMKKKKKRK